MSKNALIIGGTKGIGLALARTLHTAGHNVWALARNQNELTTTEGISFLEYDAVSGDLPDGLPDSIDMVAYCPGTINLKPFRSLKIEDFENDLQVNVIGAVRTLQGLLRPLKKSGKASIVLFSTVAVGQGMAFHASVATAKGALEGLTKSLAAELAPKIRVNCIAPSLTDTSLAEKLLSTDDKKEAGANRHPLRKVGTPDDIAAMAAFLLDDQSSWISGQIIGVDGGMSTLRV